MVLDYCPLQQGLRHNSITNIVDEIAVLDYCPLQQGLRLPSVGSTENCLHSTRLLSITTRIKTQQSNMRALEQQRGTRLLSITTRIIPAV